MLNFICVLELLISLSLSLFSIDRSIQTHVSMVGGAAAGQTAGTICSPTMLIHIGLASWDLQVVACDPIVEGRFVTIASDSATPLAISKMTVHVMALEIKRNYTYCIAVQYIYIFNEAFQQ